jgi:hypothetical protein
MGHHSDDRTNVGIARIANGYPMAKGVLFWEVTLSECLIDDDNYIPMSFADSCLVRMSELTLDCLVWTLGKDFKIYRRLGRRAIPLLMPDS